MLFVVLLLTGVAAAARRCIETTSLPYLDNPQAISLPTCAVACLASDTTMLGGVCADNVGGICKLDGGVASFYRVYAACLSLQCSSTFDRQKIVLLFQVLCGWYPNITETQAGYFGVWKIYLEKGSSTDPQTLSTVTEGETSLVAIAPPSATQSSVTASAENLTSIHGDKTSSTSQTDTSSTVRSTASSLFLAENESDPALSTSTIAGVAVGGILASAIIGCLVFFLLRHRKHSSRPVSPSIFEPDSGKIAREKAGLDEPYSGIGVGGPVGIAELDGVSPISPVMEPMVQLSISQRQARVAQNF